MTTHLLQRSAFTSRATALLLASETAVIEAHDCAVCGQAMPFEALSCDDGHDGDCPDRICTGCGGVLIIGLAPLEAATVS